MSNRRIGKREREARKRPKKRRSAIIVNSVSGWQTLKLGNKKNQGVHKKEHAPVLKIGPSNGIRPISAVWSILKDSQSVS